MKLKNTIFEVNSSFAQLNCKVEAVEEKNNESEEKSRLFFIKNREKMKINEQFPVVCGIISNHPAANKRRGVGEDSERKRQWRGRME